MSRDFETRYLGQAPDSRGLLRPPEHVFEVIEPPRQYPRISTVVFAALIAGVLLLSLLA